MSHWNWWVLFVAVFVAIGGFRMTKDAKTQFIVGVSILAVGLIGGWLIQGLSVKEHLIRVENKLDSFHNKQTALRNIILNDVIQLSERMDRQASGRPSAQTSELKRKMALLSYLDRILLQNPEVSFAKVWVGTATASWAGGTLTLRDPRRQEIRVVATATFPEPWKRIEPGDKVSVIGAARPDGSILAEKIEFQH